jgi:type IV pilus assembly protein PilW
MIATAIGLIILTGLIMVLVSNIRSRNELAKSNVQIENGRYASETIKEDVQLAGFYGDYYPVSITPAISWNVPDPCTLVLANMGFAPPNTYASWNASTNIQLPVGIHGYTGSDSTPTCLSNRKSGTDILVVHRLDSSVITIDANKNGTADTNVSLTEGGTANTAYSSLAKGYYMQISQCSDGPAEAPFMMTHNTSLFTLHQGTPVGTPSNCMNGGLTPLRKYIVRAYYISTCNDCSGNGDGIPTLKVAELSDDNATCGTDPAGSCGTIQIRPIAEGIENLQIEYGIDSNGDGVPDSYVTAPSSSDWQNVVATKIFILARNTEQSIDYTDTKQYSLSSDGSILSGTPFNDHYKRHVYIVTARATNIAGRRE